MDLIKAFKAGLEDCPAPKKRPAWPSPNRKNSKVQVMRENGWEDFTRPTTLKTAVGFTLEAERRFGRENVRLVTIK
jgi:hypothetical protein